MSDESEVKLEVKQDEPGELPAPRSVSVRKLISLASWSELVYLFLGLVLNFAAGAANPAGIYVWGRLIDAVGGGPDMATQAITLVAIGLVTWFFASVSSFFLKLFSTMQADRVRNAYYETLMSKDIGWYDVRTAASLAAELNEASEKMAAAFGDKLGAGVQGFSCFVLSMALGFYMGWKMTLVIVASVPLVAIGMFVMGEAIEQIANESQGWYAQAAALVEECLFALRTVVAFGSERREIERYTFAVKNARAKSKITYYKVAFGMGFIEFAWALANAAALFYGMTLIYYGELNGSTGKIWTGGDVLIVFFSILTGGFMLVQLEPANKALSAAKVSLVKFFQARETPSEIQCSGADNRKTVSSFESFEFKDVHFSYPARPDVKVLNGIDLRIERGQKVAFVGESGSGKSTVMSLLERFYDPSAGAIFLNGEDMRQVSPASLRSLIGYVGQEPVLFASSVRKNILYGCPTATEADVKEAAELAQLSFLNALPDGFDTFVGSGGSQFSGGQKQRIAIARAMLRKPSILFLDEATSALDNVSERMIQETLEHIGSTQGQSLTIVAIAHRLSTIQNSDVIFALQGGVVKERGNHASLMALRGIYFALADSQEPVIDVDEFVERKSVVGGIADAAKKQNQESTNTSSQSLPDNESNKEAEKAIEVPKDFKVPYGRLMQFCKPEWFYFVPGCIGAILHGANNPVQAYLIVGVLDAFYYPKDEMWNEVSELSIYFIIVAVVILLAAGIHNMCFSLISEALTQRLRVAMLTAVFRQEIGYHDDPAHTPAMMGTALSLWAYRIRTFCTSFEATCNVIASIFLGIALAFIGSWQMTLAMLGAIPVLAFAMSLQFMYMLGASTLSNENIKNAQQVVSDSVQNARTVYALGMEKSLINHHISLVKEASKGNARTALIGSVALGFSLAAPLLVMAGGMYYAAWLVKNGQTDFKGSMLAFMGILYAAMGAGQATATLGDAAKARQACYFIFSLLDRKSLIDGLDPEGEIESVDLRSADEKSAILEFKDVTFSYPFRSDVVVLKGISFRVAAGQSVGLVGPSGGGKSTIMSLLQRFYDPSGGEIFVGAQQVPLSKVNIRWWREHVGFVGQEPILFDTTVKANVLYGIDTDTNPISDEHLEKCKRMAYLDFLDKATSDGWNTEVGPRGSRLSGGQKQRVAICRALVRDPPILLLDEATSALDSESEKIVQQALETARQGRTSFSIAHRLSTIQDCDVIVVVAEGTVAESGSHATLLEQRGVYANLYATSQ
eukprot:TRINITY_DN22912_c0_g1_i1.p1 TRINITY_DN22912_c0_g1~~TRINITY_DN22912_c0_g1_i1.p1  ORF type:complete len:1253 (-),score=215.99 TRINITY_DN22912_c0_g1_i1:128-3886(-)